MLFLYIILLAVVIYVAIWISLRVKETRKQKRLETINTLFPAVDAAFNDIIGYFI